MNMAVHAKKLAAVDVYAPLETPNNAGQCGRRRTLRSNCLRHQRLKNRLRSNCDADAGWRGEIWRKRQCPHLPCCLFRTVGD